MYIVRDTAAALLAIAWIVAIFASLRDVDALAAEVVVR
jgi:hypothetical protein